MSGAGRGIGRATVERLADEGWRVAAGARDVERAAEIFAERPGVRAVPLDLTDPASIGPAVRAAEDHAGGGLDCLVNNAGYAVLGAVEEVDLAAVRAMFEVNLFGAVALTQAALPGMRRAGGGVVVMVSSVGAWLVNPLVGLYHASKFALAAVAEALAVEGRPFGIRVACVEPGMVATDFPRAAIPTGPAAGGEGAYAPLFAQLRAGFGAWREGYAVGPDEVAAVVAAAASDPATPFRVPVGADAHLLGAERARRDDAGFRDALGRFIGIDW